MSRHSRRGRNPHAAADSGAARPAAGTSPRGSGEVPGPADSRDSTSLRDRSGSPSRTTNAAAFRPPATHDGLTAPGNRASGGPHDERGRASCTAAQLRRFIKSRPWVPMHELRRRFGINGVEDDVTPIEVGERRLYIGLPGPEGELVAELLAGGDVGYELSMDPTVPIVVGVYPMRPVPRV